MSNRDYVIDIPANGSRQLDLNEPHFLFLKECQGKVDVTIDGHTSVMEKGDKKKFDLDRYTRDVAIRRVAVYVNNPDSYDKKLLFVAGQGDFEKIVVTGRVTSLAGLLTSEGLEVPDSKKEFAIASKIVLEGQVNDVAETLLYNSGLVNARHALQFGDSQKKVVLAAEADTIRFFNRGDYAAASAFHSIAPVSTTVNGWPSGVGPFTVNAVFGAAFVGDVVYCIARRSSGGSGAGNLIFKTVNRVRHFVAYEEIHRHQLSRQLGFVYNPYDGFFYNNYANDISAMFRSSLAAPLPVPHVPFFAPDGNQYHSPTGVLPATAKYPKGRLIVCSANDFLGRGAVFTPDGEFIEYFTAGNIIGNSSTILDGNRIVTSATAWNSGTNMRDYVHKTMTSFGKVYHYDECAAIFAPVPLTLPVLVTASVINGNSVNIGEILKIIIAGKLGSFDALPENYLDYIYGMRWHDGERWRERNTGSVSFAGAGVQDYFQYNHNMPVYLTVRDGLF